MPDALRVLLAEDDPWAAAAFKKALAVAAPEAVFEIVFDEDDAEDRLESAPPDILFLSLDLPACGALRLLRRRKAASGGPPIVAIASDRRDPRAESAAEAGAAEILIRGYKPGRLAELLETLGRYWRMLPAT